jgi:hypothetical protein
MLDRLNHEVTCGNNTTNWEASRTAKSQGAAAVLPTSLACSFWMGTCPSISTTIPKMSSAT